MKIKKYKFIIILSSLLVFFSSWSFAHHLWIEKDGDAFSISRGMFLDRLDTYSPACVTEISAYDTNGNKLAISRNDEKTKVKFVPAGEMAIGVVKSDWGYRVNTTKGKKLIPRKEAAEQGFKILSAFFSTQYLKQIFSDSPLNLKPLGLRLEFVPEKDPVKLKKGDILSCRLLFEGAPVSGAAVFSKDGEEFKTDDNGVMKLKINDSKSQLFYTKHKIPVTNNPDMDYLMLTGFLVFEVK